MDFLAPYHPLIVHAPVVLLILSPLFEVVGRLTDLEWWRKAGLVLLVLGVLGAGAAVLSGGPAGDAAEQRSVPEAAVDAHERLADLTLYLASLALVLYVLARLQIRGRKALTALALVVQLAAAVSVGITGYRGGMLVYAHGAAVRVKGQYVSGPEKTAAPAGVRAPGKADEDRD